MKMKLKIEIIKIFTLEFEMSSPPKDKSEVSDEEEISSDADPKPSDTK
jgi:hypothetical protein